MNKERARLEEQWVRVWDTAQLTEDFEVLSFHAPIVHVVRKSDNVPGTLFFQHRPRFYYGWAANT